MSKVEIQMKNFKLKAVALAVLMSSSVAYAGIGNVPGDGSVGNPYDMGVIGTTPTVLSVLLTGSNGTFFEEYANFSIPSLSTVYGSASTLFLSLSGFTVADINDFSVELWDSVHPWGSNLYATFTDDGITYALGNLAAGSYHLDIAGVLGATTGQYSVSLHALPVPEPETYAMLLAGLGLIGFSLRSRKAV